MSVELQEQATSIPREGEHAFIASIHKLRREARVYVARLMIDKSLVDDVVQEASIKALEAFRKEQIDRVRNMRPWYYRVLRNAAIDM